jgi:hypothetical protein
MSTQSERKWAELGRGWPWLIYAWVGFVLWLLLPYPVSYFGVGTMSSGLAMAIVHGVRAELIGRGKL